MAEYRITNGDGLRVVQVSGPVLEAVVMLHHYLLMYADEGPLKVEVRKGRRWRPLQRAVGENVKEGK